MATKNVTSLRRYRAQRIHRKFMGLPPSQRTNERASLLLEAIFDYAYEHVPQARFYSNEAIRVGADDSALISSRLEEFLPPDQSGRPIMKWLHDNMVDDAWSYPEDRRRFVRDCLQR